MKAVITQWAELKKIAVQRWKHPKVVVFYFTKLHLVNASYILVEENGAKHEGETEEERRNRKALKKERKRLAKLAKAEEQQMESANQEVSNLV